MKFKDDVVWTDIHPKIEQVLPGVEAIFQKFGVEAVITSGRDGKHMTGSKHYEGKAFDLRTWHVIDAIAKQLRAYLGKDYDVVVESDHIHVEVNPDDPKS